MTAVSVPQPEEHRHSGESYAALLGRLSRQSVNKRYEAYRDVDWNAPEMQIDPVDPRWELRIGQDALADTEWYRAQPPEVRARIGLYRIATFAYVGMQFENVLSRGLLLFLQTRELDSPEHRYAYHELVEESHHSMIFAEFVRKSGMPVRGLQRRWRLAADRVARLGASFPELFFIFVLGGEDPIDFTQRRAIATGMDMHPLLKRITQIHITEEARHLCFARSFLREHVPRLGRRRRLVLAAVAPLVLRVTADLMIRPAPGLVRELGIPREVVRQAFRGDGTYRRFVHDSLGHVRDLCDELGLITPLTRPLWRNLGA